jgi:hypothetical protein
MCCDKSGALYTLTKKSTNYMYIGKYTPNGTYVCNSYDLGNIWLMSGVTPINIVVGDLTGVIYVAASDGRVYEIAMP